MYFDRRQENKNYKTTLNFLLIVFFIYIAYIIESSPLQKTRRSIYLLLGLGVILLFIKLNVTKESLLKMKDQLTLKRGQTEKKDPVKEFIEYIVFLI